MCVCILYTGVCAWYGVRAGVCMYYMLTSHPVFNHQSAKTQTKKQTKVAQTVSVQLLQHHQHPHPTSKRKYLCNLDMSVPSQYSIADASVASTSTSGSGGAWHKIGRFQRSKTKPSASIETLGAS